MAVAGDAPCLREYLTYRRLRAMQQELRRRSLVGAALLAVVAVGCGSTAQKPVTRGGVSITQTTPPTDVGSVPGVSPTDGLSSSGGLGSPHGGEPGLPSVDGSGSTPGNG